MLEIARDRLARILDRLGKGETIGKTGEAVAKHLGAQRALRLQFDGTVDEAQQAAARRLTGLGQRRELDPVELGRNAVAVGEIQLACDIRAIEEAAQEL